MHTRQKHGRSAQLRTEHEDAGLLREVKQCEHFGDGEPHLLGDVLSCTRVCAKANEVRDKVMTSDGARKREMLSRDGARQLKKPRGDKKLYEDVVGYYNPVKKRTTCSTNLPWVCSTVFYTPGTTRFLPASFQFRRAGRAVLAGAAPGRSGL